MTKNKIIKSIFKKALIFYLMLLVLALPVAAQPDQTPGSPTSSTNPSPAVKNIRDRVKEIVREKIDELKRGRKGAYFGELTAIGGNQLTVSNRFGKNQIIINEETKIIGTARQELTLADLKTGMFIVAMGYIDTTGNLEAKRIVIMSRPKLPARQVAFGRVSDISKEENILTVKNEKKGITYSVEADEKTIITKKIDGKIQKISFDKISLNDFLVAIGISSQNETKIITAKLIHIIPGLAVGQRTPRPTTSPTTQPSPSGTPNVTPSPSPTPSV